MRNVSGRFLHRNWRNFAGWTITCKKNSIVNHCIDHSSEIRGFSLMKWPDETLQNLPYFIYTKTQSCFFHFVLLYFPPNECPVLFRLRPDNSLGKKVKKKWIKHLWGFVYIKYGKFWSVSSGHFIKHKLLISEEWDPGDNVNLAQVAWFLTSGGGLMSKIDMGWDPAGILELLEICASRRANTPRSIKCSSP